MIGGAFTLASGRQSSVFFDMKRTMFDPEGEREFLEECRDVFRQRTVLLITHRPASLAVADRIVRMEAGEFVAPVERT